MRLGGGPRLLPPPPPRLPRVAILGPPLPLLQNTTHVPSANLLTIPEVLVPLQGVRSRSQRKRTHLDELDVLSLFQSPILPTLGRSEERAHDEELAGAPLRVRGVFSPLLSPDILTLAVVEGC